MMMTFSFEPKFPWALTKQSVIRGNVFLIIGLAIVAIPWRGQTCSCTCYQLTGPIQSWLEGYPAHGARIQFVMAPYLSRRCKI